MDHPDRRGERIPDRRDRRPILARVRLTLSYAGFLVFAGAGLLALVLYLLRFLPETGGVGNEGEFVPDRTALLDALWPRMWQVLIVLLLVGLVGGWFLSTWMLRPLERIAAVARRVDAGAFDDRIRLGGARDEFRDVADTLDAMLDRLEASFEEERRFAANASHELRTPFAITRSLLDVAIADPESRDVDELLGRLHATNRRGSDIVDALLALAQLERGTSIPRQPVDIAELVASAVADAAPEAARAGITLTSEIEEGDVDGDPVLLRQAVTNLVQNAIRHNTGPGGTVDVRTATRDDGTVVIAVGNTGPVLAPEALSTLVEPFVRGGGRTAAGPDAVRGSGLGLAIVDRVARAHDATLYLHARGVGGLDVVLRFPSPD